jgi:hypothetical protein
MSGLGQSLPLLFKNADEYSCLNNFNELFSGQEFDRQNGEFNEFIHIIHPKQ